MNRIARRAEITLILALALVLGMGFFVVEYFVNAGEWVTFPGSPHVYNAGNIGCGTVTDRAGETLLDIGENRVYAEDQLLREATLHWLGDREGNISAPSLAAYAWQLLGYNPVNGIYRYGGSGGTAVLTLSAQAQRTALEALGDKKGTVAVYNYKTGELLCAVTAPSYDPDDVPDIGADESGAYEGVYLNRFTQVSYVPGSIFKVVTAGALLETMPEFRDQVFTCTGEYLVDGTYVTCEDVHGDLDLGGALTQSCNCYFAYLAEHLGGETLQKYVEQFDITEPLTFDGITTAGGSVTYSDDNLAELAWSAIGQHEDLLNPCRFMTFMGAIANGGKAAEPYLVSQVTVGHRKTYTAETVYTDSVLSRETAQLLRGYLRNNVINKYGDENFAGLSVCAKSGTAEVGGDQRPNAVFAGFSVDEAYPLAFIAVVEDGGYGRSVCVPILSEVLAVCKDAMDGKVG